MNEIIQTIHTHSIRQSQREQNGGKKFFRLLKVLRFIEIKATIEAVNSE